MAARIFQGRDNSITDIVRATRCRILRLRNPVALLSDTHRACMVTRDAAPTVGTQRGGGPGVKLAASSGLPLPLYFTLSGYGYTGRVKPIGVSAAKGNCRRNDCSQL